MSTSFSLIHYKMIFKTFLSFNIAYFQHWFLKILIQMVKSHEMSVYHLCNSSDMGLAQGKQLLTQLASIMLLLIQHAYYRKMINDVFGE